MQRLTRCAALLALALALTACGSSDSSKDGSTSVSKSTGTTTTLSTVAAPRDRPATEVAAETAAVRQRVTYIAGLVNACRELVSNGTLAEERLDCTDGGSLHRIGQKDVYDFDMNRAVPDSRLDVQVTITDDHQGFTVQAYATTNDGRVYFSHIEPRPGAVRRVCGSEPVADDAVAPVGAPALPDCVRGTWKAVAAH
ncbi:MAG: hypothetical protein JWN72_2125 [Thermoleophilia bacterium]|nr:hypothetical protein [Thermoleophilia bacterium]